jgi:hypothetical protein
LLLKVEVIDTDLFKAYGLYCPGAGVMTGLLIDFTEFALNIRSPPGTSLSYTNPEYAPGPGLTVECWNGTNRLDLEARFPDPSLLALVLLVISVCNSRC